MADKKLSKFEQKIGKLLYRFLIAGHTEDYILEKDGKVTTVPATVWYAHVLSKETQR